jgi:hypothetical protein
MRLIGAAGIGLAVLLLTAMRRRRTGEQVD